ncbi:hypothetical protein V0288_22460 [Pannus brasiliensis CCIBt3594]|uniref:YitH acetyltransferase (GNAT) domain-containing protein n=1 Tax=Pannus brasiliensis CCIBt3594 TaxID=1427578 RepID=A0AAW9QQ48_9CHRO
MLSETHYSLRSRQDGQYLVARLRKGETETPAQYILLFKESYDALSYLNAHARDLANNFAVETLSGTQLKSLMQRWGFQGIGLVTEPLEPRVQFLVYERGFNL